MIDEQIPMSSEQKRWFVRMPFIRCFSKLLANILDDKCAACSKPIKAVDFVNDEERSFYFATGYCPTCQAKWRDDIEALEVRLGLEPYWGSVSFDTKKSTPKFARDEP